MIAMEGGSRGIPESLPIVENGGSRPFTLSVATFNVGNGKRGPEALRKAMDRMVQLSAGGPGIIGFQEMPPRSAVELNMQLPQHWGMRHFINPTDPDLSMAVAFDVSQLQLASDVESVSLAPLLSWHRHLEIPHRPEPLRREAQIFHFTLTEDPSVHIVFVNTHLSVRGKLPQRQKEMDEVMTHVSAFMHREGLLDAETDTVMPGSAIATYIVGDFNTPGRVGSKRNQRQTERLQLFEQGFEKLNDRLDPTSNTLSSMLHFAHTFTGDKALEWAKRVGERARRGVRQRQLFEAVIESAQQHRDHIFSKLYGLTRQENWENKVFGPPEHPRESDHFMVFTGSVLARNSK
ncbi:MAG: hypothetical protein KGL95_09755 [Patescibacteria group bacterium]|nr:hypothetical protein [Patescibacteria group bacterium]